MTENPLDGEISASVGLTETGAQGTIKSRMANALDWAAGTWIVSKFQKRSLDSDERAAINDARLAFIKESREIVLNKIRNDPEILAPLIKAQFGIDIQKAENRAGAIGYMLEDIRATPPTEQENSSGPDVISPDTLNRWGSYAEDASSDALRERWGKILSAEVRAPGTLNPRVMRVLDEIDTETAVKFEELCKDCIDDAVPICIHGELDFNDKNLFIEAGLIRDPNLSTFVRKKVQAKTFAGTDIVLFNFRGYSLGWSHETSPSIGDRKDVFVDAGDGIAIPVHLLTDAGSVLARMLNNNEEETFIKLARLASHKLPAGKLLVYKRGSADLEYFAIDGIQTPART